METEEHTNRSTELIEFLEIDPYLYDQVIFNRGAKTIQMGENDAGPIKNQMKSTMVSGTYHIPYSKINLR